MMPLLVELLFIHLMDTVYSGEFYCRNRSVTVASLQHIDILSYKEQSVVYSCLVEVFIK